MLYKCSGHLKGHKKTEQMFEFLKFNSFHIAASFILGLASVLVFRKACQGDECILQKAPPIDEVTKSTYQIGQTCYQFKTEPAECAASGVIEAFLVPA